MVTTNVFQRVFKIRRNGSAGTAFTVDRAGRHYLVTARHVVDGIASGDSLEVWHREQWKVLPVDVVGVGQGEVDVAVLTPRTQISPAHPLEVSAGGILYGQQAYILGFPYGHDSGGPELNDGLPIPFVKSGVISALTFGTVNRIYVDTHANEGFSGGPVVFVPQGQRTDPGEFRVAGVVVGYVLHHRPVSDAEGSRLADIPENAGIVVAIAAQHVNGLIDSNPIGFELRGGGG